jgi:transcriptional regulator with XRE-family HTH domain
VIAYIFALNIHNEIFMFDFKGFRELNKLTQTKAANYFGVSQSFISQIERGIRSVPDLFISKIKANVSFVVSEQTKEVSESIENGETISISKDAWDLIQKQAQIILSQQNDNSLLIRTLENLSLKGKQNIVDGASSARASMEM